MYFAQTVKIPLQIYIPKTKHFLMYFDQTVAQIDLDPSYLQYQDTATERLEALINGNGIRTAMVVPKHFTGPGLPDIRPDFDYMCCPRCISHPSSRIGLGTIGPKVRMLVNQSNFPVLITSPVFKPWKSIALLSGADFLATEALEASMALKKRCELPVDYFQLRGRNGETWGNGVSAVFREKVLLDKEKDWNAALYEIPHDALVIISAGSDGRRMRNLLFGSLLENAQAALTNNLLVVGPHWHGAKNWHQSSGSTERGRG
jgi:hypothetical protein